MERYVGGYPVIGIRPIIDARRGPMKLRESLEDQVMALALAAKELFEENLYYEDHDLSSGSYIYSVRPIYEDCNGAATTKEVTFYESVEEMLVPNVTIYPNPVNDKLYVETQTQTLAIEIYDVYGRRQELSAISGQQSVINVVNLMFLLEYGMPSYTFAISR